MSLLRRIAGALRRAVETPPTPRLTGCEAHFAERLGLDRSGS